MMRPDTDQGDQGGGSDAARTRSIWEIQERGSRGPRPRLDRQAIAAAAVRLADDGGLAAMTMRGVAGALGTSTMSLYNYVPAKDHLAQLVADSVAGEYAYPATPPADRRRAIIELARQTRDIAAGHRWLAQLMHRPLPPGPNGLRYLDYFLGLLAGSRLDTGGKLELIAMISGFATMYGGMQAAMASSRPDSGAGAEQQAHVQAFARAAASGLYPNLAAALAEAGPIRSDADIFDSCISHLTEVLSD
jgi:AcrR family transcriptional regulator